MIDIDIKAFLKRKDIRSFISESWSVSWPMTIIMLFEFLSGITDIYIAGRVGKEIQAAYGFITQLYFIFVIVGNAISIGAISIISRAFTSGVKEELSRAIISALITTIVAGVILGAGGILFTKELIGLANIPNDLKPIVVLLGKVYAGGLVFHCILICTNGILRACKKVRDSMKTMAIVCFINIVINFVLVLHTPVGFIGIAFSTAISVLIGGAINMWHVKSLIVHNARGFSTRIAKRIIEIGWPSGVLQILWQINTMVVFLILSAIPKKSVEVLAAFTSGMKVESSIFLPAIAFNMANAVIVGNLLGEDRKKDAYRASLITASMGVVIVSMLSIIVLINARWIAPLLSDNRIVNDETIKYIYISMLSEPFMALWVILGGALNGAGDTKGVMIVVGSCIWFVRIPLSYIFVVLFGFSAVSVWWAMNLSQFLMALFMTRRYIKKAWLRQTF